MTTQNGIGIVSIGIHLNMEIHEPLNVYQAFIVNYKCHATL